MNSIVNFLLESGISLALLSLIYILFLRKETLFMLNRMFLLLSVSFSVILPFLRFRIYEPQAYMLPEVTVTPYRNLLELVTVYGHDFSGAVSQAVVSNRMIVLIYMAGLVLFAIRLLYRLIQVYLVILRNPVRHEGKVRFVVIKEDISPYSFMNFIFINTSHEKDPGYEKMIAHEMEHIRQGHTWDVLILEIMSVFHWFNPFMWILVKTIRENHEYLADRAVLNSGFSKAQYKLLLLSQVTGVQPDIANNFNSSLIKNRIKMISKIKSAKVANVKYVAGLLTLVALTVAFACERMESEQLVLNQIETTDQQSVAETGSDEEQVFALVEQMPEFPGGEMELRNYLASNVKYPVEARDNKVQGKVYVTFTITKEGKTADAKIARSVDPLLDAEALRVINTLPDWKPGIKNGEPVNTSFTIPINFVLQ